MRIMNLFVFVWLMSLINIAKKKEAKNNKISVIQ